MPEIKTGEDLLHYTNQLITVTQLLEETLQTCNDVRQRLDDGMYQGRAMDDMRQYFQMLTVHVSQLMNLYQKASQYVMNTYITSYKNDEQLGQWLLANLEAERGRSEYAGSR